MVSRNIKIGFIGVGNMASAIIKGICEVGGISYGNLYLYDIITDKLDAFAKNGANFDISFLDAGRHFLL